MNEYQLYQDYLGEIPEFLKKYLTLDIITRLKDITLFCGMEYASKYVYNFNYFISRFNHSLNAALITWNLTHDKKVTLATLFHDVASPVFSHVIDYMNGDYVNQESTEEKTEEILRLSKKLKEYLKVDNINIETIINFKDYSVADLPRPYMCADRLENTISSAMGWINDIKFEDIKDILDSIYLEINEDGLDEIAFKDKYAATYFKYLNDEINRLTHTNFDTYMMMLAADMVRLCLNLEIFSYNDLFKLGEREVINIIKNNIEIYPELDKYWNQFTNIKEIPHIKQPQIKNKIVNPLVRKKRLN